MSTAGMPSERADAVSAAPWRIGAATAIGGCCGSLCRGGMQWAMGAIGWPAWGAHIVTNVLGAALVGVLFAWWSDRDPRGAPIGIPPRLRVREHLLVAGFLGGFTTVSGLAWDVVSLVEGGDVGPAVVALAANGVVGIAACAMAYRVSVRLRRPDGDAASTG
jgi:CrcB protein